MGHKPRKTPTPPLIPDGPHAPDPDCKSCNGTGHVNKIWSAPAGRIGCNMYREACMCGILRALKKALE